MGARGVNGGDYVMRPPVLMSLDDVARAVGGMVYGSRVGISGVTIDSRAVATGDLFVAIVGERFDGHAYVEEAMRKGAVAALTAHRVEAALPIPQVVDGDTRIALGKLAADWRSRFALPQVALTGRNGKNTVKEMIASILAAHVAGPGEVLATQGNFNNDIGMPLTLLALRSTHRYAVIELGMNHLGEIEYLSRLAAPAVALVNNAQRAHIGLLGSVEAVARAKGEIYSGLGPGGIAIVNADDPFADYWKGLNAGRRIVTFGVGSSDAIRPDVHVSAEGAQARFVTPVDAFVATLQVAGEHNLRNAAAACAVAHALEIPPHAIQEGLTRFRGVPGRLQRRAGVKGAVLIDDTYNANPESMKAALAVLSLEGGRRVFVMGDMGELGDTAGEMHAEVGRFAREVKIDEFLALGPESAHAAEAFGPAARHFESREALVEAAATLARAGTVILVKGSRFMQMERVADALASEEGSGAA
jgi:UDP-N-acetylmuramoyl-tripeptide--D-alanyl-D-alanine ligase